MTKLACFWAGVRPFLAPRRQHSLTRRASSGFLTWVNARSNEGANINRLGQAAKAAAMPNVVIVPWYDQDDFALLRQMTSGVYLPHNYEEWHINAVAHTMELLGKGTTTQVVRLNIDDYFDWLYDHCVPDTMRARLQYLCYLSGEVDCEVHDIYSPKSVVRH